MAVVADADAGLLAPDVGPPRAVGRRTEDGAFFGVGFLLCLEWGLAITATAGPDSGKTFPAIYELKGDTLRICYDLSGAKSPTEFKSIAGTKLYAVTYNRKEE